MQYAVVTFGCRVNQAESLVIEEQLRARGATPVSPDEADLVIVNSCSVTASADQGTRQTIRRIVRANPGVQVVVTGCYATRQPEDLRALPNVMQVALNADKDRLGKALTDRFNLTTAQRFGDGADACGGTLAPGASGRTALTLRVQTGCEEQCSDCIIPQTRGAGRSRPLPGIVAALQRAVTAGYKEYRHYWCASRVVRVRSARRVVVDGPRADLERMERRCAVPGQLARGRWTARPRSST